MIKDTYELTEAVGSLLHFPKGVSLPGERSFRGPMFGLLEAAPRIQFVTDVTVALPEEAFLVSESGWTLGAEVCPPGWSFSRLGHVLQCSDAVQSCRDSMNSNYYAARKSRREKELREAPLKKAQSRLQQAIFEGRLQPCRILVDSKLLWVWVHLDDVEKVEQKSLSAISL
jgi:hypothetical protein